MGQIPDRPEPEHEEAKNMLTIEMDDIMGSEEAHNFIVTNSAQNKDMG